MLIRKCAKGSKVYIFKPRTKENATYTFSEDESVSFDAQNKSYIVVSDGAVIKRTNSFSTAQSSFLKESKDEIQKLEIGKHTLINGVAAEIK
jgi:hypothetical protein|tara:strand:- start:1434 stop:1709 length:276 start_codon:yes stop_codon:yes gene_type:complete